jgi:hypothetical protein
MRERYRALRQAMGQGDALERLTEEHNNLNPHYQLEQEAVRYIVQHK